MNAQGLRWLTISIAIYHHSWSQGQYWISAVIYTMLYQHPWEGILSMELNQVSQSSKHSWITGFPQYQISQQSPVEPEQPRRILYWCRKTIHIRYPFFYNSFSFSLGRWVLPLPPKNSSQGLKISFPLCGILLPRVQMYTVTFLVLNMELSHLLFVMIPCTFPSLPLPVK